MPVMGDMPNQHVAPFELERRSRTSCDSSCAAGPWIQGRSSHHEILSNTFQQVSVSAQALMNHASRECLKSARPDHTSAAPHECIKGNVSTEFALFHALIIIKFTNTAIPRSTCRKAMHAHHVDVPACFTTVSSVEFHVSITFTITRPAVIDFGMCGHDHDMPEQYPGAVAALAVGPLKRGCRRATQEGPATERSPKLHATVYLVVSTVGHRGCVATTGNDDVTLWSTPRRCSTYGAAFVEIMFVGVCITVHCVVSYAAQ